MEDPQKQKLRDSYLFIANAFLYGYRSLWSIEATKSGPSFESWPEYKWDPCAGSHGQGLDPRALSKEASEEPNPKG